MQSPALHGVQAGSPAAAEGEGAGVNEAPRGYHWEWCVDDAWKIGGEGRKCRMKGCPNSAVAALKRARRTGATWGFSWWHYCALHLYGRKIEDGVVKFRRLVENAGTGSGTQ